MPHGKTLSMSKPEAMLAADTPQTI